MSTLLWVICIAGISAICYHEHKLECREYRQKHGMSKAEFRHYRKMMTNSDYCAKYKKSPAKAEPSQSIHHYN